MYEMIALAAGVILAFWMLRWGPEGKTPRWITVGAYSLVVGVIAATVSGEVAESWLFILLDAAATLVAYVVTAVVLRQFGYGDAGQRENRT